jgi:hypothetical protein
MQYTILVRHHEDYLSEDVNTAISEGWEPIGGVCFGMLKPNDANPRFYQAMIRKARKKSQASKEAPEGCYTTAKGVIMSLEQSKAFEELYKAYGLPKGKADAADAWLKLKVGPKLHQAMLAGAKLEAKHRNTENPKWLQGWLTARRWEDSVTESGAVPVEQMTWSDIVELGKRVNVHEDQFDSPPEFKATVMRKAKEEGLI